MQVLKFGGSSVANADNMSKVVDIVTKAVVNKRQWTKADVNPDGTKPYPWLINKAPAETENAGYIGFQGLHGNEPVVFRNAKIKKLEMPQRPNGPRGERP